MMTHSEFSNRVSGRMLILLLSVVVIAASCSLGPKDRTNPLDPLAPYDPFDVTLSLIDTVDVDTAVRRIQLNWKNIDHVALREYHVYRRVPVQADGFTMVSMTQPPLTAYTDTEAVVENAYFYLVVALMGDGTDSIYSEEVKYLGRFDPRY